MNSSRLYGLSELLSAGRTLPVIVPRSQEISASKEILAPKAPSLTCKRCGGLEFVDASAFRSHFKDEHENVDDNDSSDGDSIEQGDNSDDEAEEGEHHFVQGPFLPVVVQDQNILVHIWKALLPAETVASAILGRPEVLPLHAIVVPGDIWLIALYRGGYFAAVVMQTSAGVNEATPAGQDAAGGLGFPRVLLHKRFARYTTRRKQGGSQRAHDASTGHAAKSIGAQLRRQGEASLIQDIHSLWQEPVWSAAVSRCSRVFISAAKTTVRDLFDGRVLAKGDGRVRRVPMGTGRPTFAEAVRVGRTLAQVRVIGPYDPAEPVPNPSTTMASQGLIRTERSKARGRKEDGPEDGQWSGAASPAPNMAIEVEDVDDGDTDGEDIDNGTAVPGAEGSGHTKAQSKRAARRKRTGKRRPGNGQLSNNVAQSDEDDGAVDDHPRGVAREDDDEAILAAAVEAAQLDRYRHARSVEASASVSVLVSEAVRDIRGAASMTGVPAGVLARMLRAETLDAAFRPRASGTGVGRMGGGGNSGRVDTVALEAILPSVREQLDTLATLLLGCGDDPAEAFACMGWEGLSAAVTVTHAGLQVDWSDVQPPPLQSAERTVGAQAVRLQAVRGTGRGRGRGKGAAVLTLDAEHEPQPAAGPVARATAAPPLVQIAAHPTVCPTVAARLAPTDAQAMAGLDDREARRLAVRQAAEARWASMQQARAQELS